jgi:membrane-associated protein
MDFKTIIDFALHVDKYIASLISQFGVWIYAILFAIIFLETGLVIFPFLPGDTLLFIIGSLSATNPTLNVFVVSILLFIAAVLGDSFNYWLGKTYGRKLISLKKKNGSHYINPLFLTKTEEFFTTHGPKTIVLARFVAIVRTFAPFTAGISHMEYKTFLKYNIIGAFVWVFGLVFAGYFFGQIPFVKDHFEVVIYAVLAASLIYPIYEFLKYRKESKL